ncbi:MAG TPA: phosphoribosylformylglycinamidine cyclo-ligase [Candidatus Nitrosocosmicus sp.]|nr:phosphoribosylformylglycinamidine cyclo-ligase [Candidatus Nitrosocosmicus sp.]
MKYSDVGIDVKKIKSIQALIGKSISSTHGLPIVGKVVSGFGHYAGIIQLGNNLITLHTDGVGSKIMIAQQMERYDTVGIDCIAMNVNDTICVGATPVGFLSYVALQKTNDNLLNEITKGLVKGAKMSKIAIVGGETAILPDIITGSKKGYNFDLAGMTLGLLKDKKKLKLGNMIKPGDIIIGLKSSGLHSNGYTLARKVLLEKHKLDDTPEFLKTTVGNELLRPTSIYTHLVLELLELFDKDIHGLAHITGGGFTKLKRLNPHVDYILDKMPPIYGIFKQIQLDGNVTSEEMYRTFNMGIGFCLIVSKNIANDVIKGLRHQRIGGKNIGTIKRNGTGETFIKTEDMTRAGLIKL